MNNTIRAILRKDLRRFWPLLSLWTLALVTRAGIVAWVPLGDTSVDRGETMFAGLLVVLVNVLLVSRVLAEDSPLKENAFWRTRPISGAHMLAAKTIFLAAWTLLLPTQVTAVAAFAYDFTVGEFVGVVVGQLFVQGLTLLIFGLFSVFTTRVWTSLLGLWLVFTIAGVLLGRPLLAGAMTGGGVREDMGAWVPASLQATRFLVAALVLTVAALGAAWFVYRERRRGMAALALGLGLLGVAGAVSAWPVNLLGWLPSMQGLDARADARVLAKLSHAPSQDWTRTHDGLGRRRLFAQVAWQGLEDGEVALPYRVEGALVGPTGPLGRQAFRITDNFVVDSSHALRELGATTSLDGLGRMAAPPQVTLAELPESEWAKLKDRPIEWRGRLWVRVGKVSPEWRVPAWRGARHEQGAHRVVVAERSISGDRLQLSVAGRSPDDRRLVLDGADSGALAGASLESYVLVWPGRGIFMRATGSGGSSLTNDGLFRTSTAQVHFLAPRTEGAPNRWDEAELLRFGFVETRRVIVEAHVTLETRDRP